MTIADTHRPGRRVNSAEPHRLIWGALALILLLGVFHGMLAPFAPGAAGAGPPLAEPRLQYPFGTDLLGRDLWSESLHALGVTISAAWLGTVFVLLFGNFAGLVAAHLVAPVGQGARVAANVLVSIPALLLAILFSALLQPGSAAVAAGLAVAPAAFLRSYDRARAIQTAPYSDFARASGASRLTLLRRDLMHELRQSLVRTIARYFAAVAVAFSTMSFFGFGAAPPDRDLGLMIASARANLPDAWWTAAAPAATLILLLFLARLAAALRGGERA